MMTNNNTADTTKALILDEILSYFTKSEDFNGMASYNLNYHDLSEIEINNLLIDLIDEDKISIIGYAHDSNPHIIRFGFPSKKEQIEFLRDECLHQTFCIYPTNLYLKKILSETSDDIKYPFQSMLRFGEPQFKALFFSWDVLHKYASDPRYIFDFSDYSGSIETLSSSELNDNQKIHIKTFGIGKDEFNNKVVVTFPKYLAQQPSAIQIEWHSKLIIEQSKCATLEDYLKNQFECCWHFPNTVYRSILEEIQNINRITQVIFSHNFFKDEYLKEDLHHFDMLTLPTYKEYNNFILLFEKVIVSNIDEKFFDIINITRKREDGTYKGSLTCLSEWLNMVCPDGQEEITSPLKQIRKIRQNPAHKIEEDKFDQSYFSQQQKVAEAVFWALYKFRKLLLTHPKAVDIDLVNYETNLFIIP